MNGTISLQSKLKGAVSMANTIINGGASPYPKTVGPAAIASFSDGAQDAPLKSLVFDIEPVQSGSGDPSPTNIRPISGWSEVKVTRAGKNLLDTNDMVAGILNPSGAVDVQNVTIQSKGNGSVAWVSTGTWRGVTTGFIDVRGNNVYCISLAETVSYVLYAWYDRNKSFISRASYSGSNMQSVTAPDNAFYVRFTFQQSATGTYTYTNIQLELGSTATAYEPYQGTPITISLGQTVYGGTLDVVRGKLNVKPYYASYSGQTLVGPWISSHDKYVAGETPTTGAQVVDMGAAGTNYDVTPQTIKTLKGTNNIWADAGDTTLEYYPAAASIVSVLNRSSKVYTSIPLGKIRYETYQITPQQTIDLDSYRSENGNLLRNPVATKCKIEFNTPLMTDSEWADVWKIIKAGFNNNTERKLKLRYYDTLSATYKTGYFYVPDVQTTIRNIEEGAGVINYNEIRIAFIEY